MLSASVRVRAEHYKDYTWTVGDLVPREAFDWKVVEIMATEEELAFIRENMTHLPDVLGSNCIRWFGETARFIWANLPTA